MRVRRRTLARLLAVVFVVNLVVMGVGAWYSAEQAPPIPETVEGPEGETLVTAQQVREEGVIELLSHRDDRTSRIVSSFVVGDSDDKAKTQGKKHLRSCVDAASGVRSPEAAVLH
jgi:hypothetical protein